MERRHTFGSSSTTQDAKFFSRGCPEHIHLENTLRANGSYFVDQDFPADPSSLDQSGSGRWNAVWKRPNEFLRDSIHVFHGISPCDVIQGQLGDCYFLCALSVLAEFPERIKRLFVTKHPNEYGCYCLRICKNGLWQYVIIDDLFPCSIRRPWKPIFSDTESPEIWVLLLEKAYAKLHGSYGQIEAGSPLVALMELSGAPCESVNIKSTNLNILCRNLKEWDRKRFVMAASIIQDPNHDLEREVGLIEDHAYALIDVYEERNQKNEFLLKLRNPWGKVEWQGDWSDKSDKWTPELKEILGWTDQEDGTFWMSIHDFVKYFENVYVLYYHDDWVRSTLETEFFQGAESLIKISVSSHTMGYISVHQRDARCFHNTDYSYEPVRFVVFQLSPKFNEIKASDYIAGKDLICQVDLEAGEYIIVLEGYTRPSPCVVSMYATEEVDMVEILDTTFGNYARESILESCKEHGKKKDFGDVGAPQIVQYWLNYTGGFAILIENDSTSRKLTADYTFELKDMELIGEQDSRVHIDLETGESKAIIARRTAINHSFKFSSRYGSFPTTRGSTVAHREPPAPTDSEKLAVRRFFDMYDVDNNGTMDANELKALLEDMGQSYTEAEVAILMNELDLNSDGVLDFEEFWKWWTG